MRRYCRLFSTSSVLSKVWITIVLHTVYKTELVKNDYLGFCGYSKLGYQLEGAIVVNFMDLIYMNILQFRFIIILLIMSYL